MFGKDEHTLYKPAGTPAAGGGRGEAGASGAYRPQAASLVMEDEDAGVSLGDLLKYSINAARRRALLSVALLLVGGGLTAAAVKLAPRTYLSTGEVLIVSAADEQPGWMQENRRQQLEWERQVRSREAVDGIVRDAQLVEKWDDMRQPHRILIDQINAKMGERPPSADQKFAAVEGMVENNLRLNIDQSTVSIQCEWSEPEAARDIVQAAMSRFIDKRYQTEVGTILTRIKPLEDQLESARLTLEGIDPSLAPPKAAPTEATPAEKLVTVDKQPSAEAIEAGRKLPAARDRAAAAAGRVAEIENARQGRIAHLKQEKAARAATFGASHPEMIAIDLQLKEAEKETSDLIDARAKKAAADAEVADLSRLADVPIPKRSLASAPNNAPTKKVDELTLQKITAARDEYNRKKDALDNENLKLRVAEAAFKSKYQITQPAEVPIHPKKPVALMVALGGALATILIMLALATLRDRSVGIFFEAKQVRDRLRLPVLGDIKEADIVG